MERQEKLYQILSKVLRISINAISDGTGPDNVENWDSMNALLLVAELERGFKIKFTLSEVTSIKCVGDLKTVLKNHKVSL